MKKKVISICLILLIFVSLSVFLYNMASSYALIENGSKVMPNSELTYYIDVLYDGKDSDSVLSSDNNTSNIFSDIIYVRDKLPEGLTFKGFVSSTDGTIGAISRDGNSSCSGYVIDGYDGLEYDSSDNTINFRVKSLQAGCMLTVGVVTITPELNDSERLDFYNYASAKENNKINNSNTVHVYMGEDSANLYSVRYEYYGDVPDSAPTEPEINNYKDGTIVDVEDAVELPGYSFEGWNSNDIEVSSQKYVMPNKNVLFRGSFNRNIEYNVKYIIDGPMPENFIIPESHKYGTGEVVRIDSLQEGTIIDGYKFLGWTYPVEVNDDMFVMPSEDIEIIGMFEEVTYKVSYAFQGSTIPENVQLPAEKRYRIGEEVILEDDLSAEGYKFIGWYSEKSFKMPENDVIIYGEWMKIEGKFSPRIEKIIIDKKDKYVAGDIVKFKTIISNDEEFEIKDVMVEELLDDSYFIEGDGYIVETKKYVKIPTIASKDSVTIYSEYVVNENSAKEITNTVSLIGATADNNFILDDSKEYKSKVSFYTTMNGKNDGKVEEPTNTVDNGSNENSNIKNTPLTHDPIKKYIILAITSLVSIIVLVCYFIHLKKKEK